MTIANERIALAFGGLDRWVSTAEVIDYDITSDMLRLADQWQVTLPIKRDLWDACELGNEVSLHIEGQRVLSGYIDTRLRSNDQLTVTGRDRGGYLIDESAPLKKFKGENIKGLVEELVGDLFDSVTLTNADNRALIAGRGRKRGTAPIEPILEGRDVIHRVQPGQSKAAVMGEFLEQGKMLAWSTADGRQMFVGEPNQNQRATWFFLVPEPGGPRVNEPGRVKGVTYIEDNAQRYTAITVVGHDNGGGTNYGRNVTRKRGVAVSPQQWVRDRELMIVDAAVGNADAARERAEREMLEREASGISLEVVMPGHGQVVVPGQPPAIYHFDSVARYVDNVLGIAGEFFVTAVNFRGNHHEGETAISLVPVGTPLRSNG